MVIKKLPKEERPYEKCLEHGAVSLSDAELLAVLLRTGARGASSVELARKILDSSTQNYGILGLVHLSVGDLQKINGIGQVKAIQIKCIAEFTRRIAKAQAKERLSFQDPDTIADYYMEDLRHEEQEILMLLMLNTKNELIAQKVMTRGTVNTSLISPREIFTEALAGGAVYIILLHNHPSGDPSPSKADIFVTKRIKEAGSLIGIALIDHIIIGDNKYKSLRSEGLI